MIRFGASMESALYFIRDWYAGGFRCWHVEPTPLRVEDPRLREWNREFGLDLPVARREAIHRQSQPTAFGAQLPCHSLLGGHQLILMATKDVQARNAAQVWKRYQWSDRPVQIGPFELVKREGSGPRGFRWSLCPDQRKSIENWTARALASDDERSLRSLERFVDEGLPKIDGIHDQVARLIEAVKIERELKRAGLWSNPESVGAPVPTDVPRDRSRESTELLQEDLAGFELLRRRSEEEGIAQDGPISDTALKEILQRIKSTRRS